MKITYLYHSGFLVEWEHCCFLFDYIRGDIPAEALQKPFFVFCSHSHPDHFDPKIFSLFAGKPDTHFVLAKQIGISPARLAKWGVTPRQQEQILRLSSGQTVACSDSLGQKIQISTLSSTDMGVAFLLTYEGKCLYHAGDLNDWQWNEESESWNQDMHRRYMNQMEKLQGREIDVAFVPLDPRMEEHAACGLNELLETARVKAVFPMHMWDHYEIGGWWKKEGGLPAQAGCLREIRGPGQQWML